MKVIQLCLRESYNPEKHLQRLAVMMVRVQAWKLVLLACTADVIIMISVLTELGDNST